MTAVSTIEIEVDGRRLGGRTAEPDGGARALVIALHGGSHECTAPPRLKPYTPGRTRRTDPTPQVSVLRGERHHRLLRRRPRLRRQTAPRTAPPRPCFR
jgi:hypothetical protein